MRDNGSGWQSLVEPDRVHRRCYTDPEIFDAEIANIFERAWIYVGHESQVKEVGDYYTMQIGREPMIMVRGKDGKVNVLYNRCPHRGALLCSDHSGNTGTTFKCPYHAWRFNLDGSLLKVPVIDGYAGTRFDAKDPQFHMEPALRVESYRGFVFASLAKSGPDLVSFLGGAKIAFDDMCDRAPEGQVEVVPNCFRMIQKSNWKIFLENQLDAVHPSVTHEAAGRAALEVEKQIKQRTGKNAPLDYHYLSAFTEPFYKFDMMDNVGFANGHVILKGYMDLRRQDPEMIEYEALMHERHGKDRTEEILSVDIHHVLVYPCLSVQPPLQQLRAIRPIGPDRTLTEIWHFRLKGAPEGMYRRALGYYQLVNSPSTTINADDLDNWWRCQQGLNSTGKDWVSFHRNAGQDKRGSDQVVSITGMSELPMRHMFEAWTSYMKGGVGR
jgi:phenylpropionate dioxygenase-like ring-hydroxylating dioxygenase large terminal subunit